MINLWKTGVLFFCIVLSAFILWRLMTRYFSFPCPWWLSKLLENPYMDAVAGSSMMIGRLGIKKGMKILDAGCGPGRITIPIAKFVGSEGEVTALDIQQKMLEMVKKKIQKEKLQNIKTIHGGLGFGLLKKDMFDRALLVTVLGEIPAQVEALKEIHESLKSGGFLSVIEVLPDPHYQRVSKVRRLASQAGFREHDYSGNWRSYTIIFVKN